MSDDFLDDLMPAPGERPDPTAAARQAMRPPLPKRFYREAAAREQEGGFALVLDGRPARTPGRNPLLLPTRAAGEAVAAEWEAQAAEIDPARMPMTRIANSALDGVAGQEEPVRADIARYAGSDLVVYRAAEPDRLVAEQAAAWNPVLAYARDELGARFVLAEGVMFVEQSPQALEAVAARLARETSPHALAALHVMTALGGSVLIALAVADGALDVDAAWAAIHVDEAYQESVWGEDAEAMERRRVREADFRAAAAFYSLSRAGG